MGSLEISLKCSFIIREVGGVPRNPAPRNHLFGVDCHVKPAAATAKMHSVGEIS